MGDGKGGGAGGGGTAAAVGGKEGLRELDQVLRGAESYSGTILAEQESQYLGGFGPVRRSGPAPWDRFNFRSQPNGNLGGIRRNDRIVITGQGFGSRRDPPSRWVTGPARVTSVRGRGDGRTVTVSPIGNWSRHRSITLNTAPARAPGQRFTTSPQSSEVRTSPNTPARRRGVTVMTVTGRAE